MHDEYSLLDSCTKAQDYIDLSVENGCKALSVSNHGKPLNWTETWAACKKAGIRYIHSVEIYLTEQLEPKTRDNYHTVLMAKNMEGVKELNSLVSMSCEEDHFYYTNRISFDEFLNISDNIISTSACLASPLNRLADDNPYYDKLVDKYDFLEIQPHNHPDQIRFNKRLFELSKKHNKPLIVGTDTHSSSKYKAECRAVLLKAKHKSYGDEDAFDLSFKTYDELVEMFRTQGAIPIDVCIEALNNTDLLYDMTEDIELDLSIKYPIIYGSKEEDSQMFEKILYQKLQDKIDKGIIKPEFEAKYKTSLEEEIKVFRQLDMCGFMLMMADITKWCRANGINLGPGRGSVGGSRVAYILDITEIDAERWNTVFSRFANPNRVEVGDIDIDCVESDRPKIFEYITQRFGSEKTARVASFGTLQDKATIDEIGRALAIEWDEKYGDTHDAKENPYSLSRVAELKKKYEENPDEAKLSDKTLFYFFDGLVGTKISQSVHPAGLVVSPITLKDNYGVFDKDGDRCLFLTMNEVHDLGLVKQDFLILKTVKVIEDVCKYIGKPYPHMWEIDFDDQDVWQDMRANMLCCFQFEGSFAADCFKRMGPTNLQEMALVNACIRPSGASYRDRLLARIPNKNPSEMIDNLLKDNLGYLVYQEDTIKFLQEICGFSGGDADSVRRGIGRKIKEVLDDAMPKILDGYCSKSDKPRDVAESEAKEFMQIIEDSANYQFNYSHAIAYCMVGYLCGYYRHYYPIEFLTSYLNNAANDEDIRMGTECAKRLGIRITMPKWGFSKGEYYFDKEQKVIAKGLSSIKGIGSKATDNLYKISRSRVFSGFTDVLMTILDNKLLDQGQLETLIKIDFFSEYGNQRELLFIKDTFFSLFKKGEAKKIRRETVENSPFMKLIQTYSTDVNKDGSPSAFYTIVDMQSVLGGIDDVVRAAKMPDLTTIEKIKNFEEVTGYLGYTTGKEEDRRKLLLTDIKPLYRKKDKKQFGYSFFTKSIGSGIEARFTVFNSMYNVIPVKKGDIVYCKRYTKDGPYFRMDEYSKIE